MKRPPMPFEWQVRKRAAMAVSFLLEKLHGEDAARDWLWGLTPFPATAPRWGECVQGMIAAFLPGKFHDRFMIEQHRKVDISMERAMRGWREDAKEAVHGS
jgi:hypothetical protein